MTTIVAVSAIILSFPRIQHLLSLDNPNPIPASVTAIHSSPQVDEPLYQVGSQQGWQKWFAPPQPFPNQWKTGGDALVSNGSSLCCSAPDGIIYSPYEPPTNNYAIEAQIQVFGLGKNHSLTEAQCCNFGFIVRGSQGNNHRYAINIRLSDTNTLSANEDLVAVGIGPQGFSVLCSVTHQHLLLESNRVEAYW